MTSLRDRARSLIGVVAVAACGCTAGAEVRATPVAPVTFTHAPHDGDRFANLYGFTLPSWGDLARWYWDWTLAGGTTPPAGGYDAMPVLRPDLGYLRANRTDTTVTWVGHATVLLQLAGVNVVTDPMFSQRASPFDFVGPSRKIRVPFALADAPHVDVVLISHNHYDHLDAGSIDALAAQAGGPPLYIVPRGVDAWLRARGITNVVALDWWDVHDVGSASTGGRLRITMVPSQHWSARGPFDRFETLWGGYVVERKAPDDTVRFRFYCAGDTGYAPLFHDLIHARSPRFDLAAIPIGAYEPNRYLKAQHVNPAEAVRIHRELDVALSIGIHWGTFVLTTESFDQQPRDLAIARSAADIPEERFVAFRHGEMRVLQRAGATSASASSPTQDAARSR